MNLDNLDDIPYEQIVQWYEATQWEKDNPPCPLCGAIGSLNKLGWCEACPKEPPTVFSWMAN